MDKRYFQTIYDYNFQANRKVWDCVMQLTDEQFYQPLDFSVGAIHIQVAHTMMVEYWWFHFLMTGEPQFLEDEEWATRAQIRAHWDALETKIMAYLDTLTPEEMERDVRPPFWEPHRKPIKHWQAMVQVANHSTDHRAQTLAMIHKLGGKTVGQDVLDYLFAMQEKETQTQ